MSVKEMATPNPDPVNWENILGILIRSIASLIGFIVGANHYFKLQRTKADQRTLLAKLDKENAIKEIAIGAVSDVLKEVHDDIKVLKNNRDADLKHYNGLFSKLMEAKK